MKVVVPVFKPYADNREWKYLKEVMKSGWWGMGPMVEEFERKFSKFIGTQYAVAVNSATAALHLSLKCIEIEGKEVITTPLTFVSTNHAILYNRGIPIFCDIESDTLNIDASKIESLITSKTKAIICVHYGGHACDMDRIMRIARKYNLFVVEDCAHACGGQHRGKMLGPIGDFGCFSFNAVKNLATGDGGMITLNNKSACKRLKSLRWVGIDKDTFLRSKSGRYAWLYDVKELGYKYQMTDIIAAVGLAQLEKLAETNKKRGKLWEYYCKQLKKVKDIEIPVRKNYAQLSYHNYVIKTLHREGLHNFLKEKGISTGVHYYPNHLYPMYKKYYRKLPIAERTWKRLLTLPLYPSLKTYQADRVVRYIKAYFRDK